MFPCSNQAIHCHVYSTSLEKYLFLSAIYTSNGDTKRRTLWTNSCSIHGCMANVVLLLVGYFNVILNMSKRSVTIQGMLVARNVLEFISCIEDIGVTDLHADDHIFT